MEERNETQTIHFLRTTKVPENMIQAFASLNREILKPAWIEFKDVGRLINEMSGAVLVIDSIDSREAKQIRYMCKRKSKSQPMPKEVIPLKIFTAYALVSINPREIKQLPTCKYPISSICMKNCHITVSGLGPKRSKEMMRKLMSMGASFRRGLHKRTSYVIADDWTSSKVSYIRRCRGNASCVIKPEWVERCWEMRENLKDAKQLIDQFKLPIFTGMSICVTGVSFFFIYKIFFFLN